MASVASQANSCSGDMCDPISYQLPRECLTAGQEVFLEEEDVQGSPIVTCICGDEFSWWGSKIFEHAYIIFIFDILLHSPSSKVGYLRSRWAHVNLFWSGIGITLCHSFYVYVLCDGQFSWLLTLLRHHGRWWMKLGPVPFQFVVPRMMQQKLCSHPFTSEDRWSPVTSSEVLRYKLPLLCDFSKLKFK